MTSRLFVNKVVEVVLYALHQLAQFFLLSWISPNVRIEDFFLMLSNLACQSSFSYSSQDFWALFWISNAHDFLKLRSSVLEEIYQQLKKAKVEAPFPQRDLHIKSGLPGMDGKMNSLPRKTPRGPESP